MFCQWTILHLKQLIGFCQNDLSPNLVGHPNLNPTNTPKKKHIYTTQNTVTVDDDETCVRLVKRATRTLSAF